MELVSTEHLETGFDLSRNSTEGLVTFCAFSPPRGTTTLGCTIHAVLPLSWTPLILGLYFGTEQALVQTRLVH